MRSARFAVGLLLGGMILFARNWQDREQLAAIQQQATSLAEGPAASGNGSGGPPFVPAEDGTAVFAVVPVEAETATQNADAVEELRSRVDRGEVDTVLVALTDMQGRLQGKRCGARYFFEEVLPPLDERFLDALAHGLPQCAGVALGVDRLLMAMLGTDRIAEVLAFDFARG